MKLFASDFDHTLFKRYEGLKPDVVDYVESRRLPVWIVTYRAADQAGFILDTLAETGIEVLGFSCAGDRKKNPENKILLMQDLIKIHTVEEALDDDPQVVVGYRNLGITANTVDTVT